VRRLVVGGVGSGIIECGGVDRRAVPNEAIIAALEVEDPSTIREPGAATFRMLADALNGDRKALAAQASSVFRGEIALGGISAPTLVLAGDADPLAIDPRSSPRRSRTRGCRSSPGITSGRSETPASNRPSSTSSPTE
jgi:pimeloyl-ACP methyl ester carboxylesterase